MEVQGHYHVLVRNDVEKKMENDMQTGELCRHVFL